MNNLTYTSLIALGLLMSACTDETERPETTVYPNVPQTSEWASQPLQAVKKGNVGKANSFATDLFRNAFKMEGSNLCVSPVSVFCTFAMMANGDTDECRDEVLNLLGYGKGPGELHDLNIFCNALLAEVPALNGPTQCTFTNSLWYHPDVSLLPDFTADMENIYKACLFPVWLGDEEGRMTVNSFVKEHTAGMIEEFLSEPVSVSLAFMNTTYFKGTWQKSFDKEMTYNNTFHNLDGTDSEASYMLLNDIIEYGESDGFRGVCLPYAGDRYTMTVIQPSDGSDFNKMLSDFNGDSLEQLHSSFQPCELTLRLPKFESEVNIELLDCLKEMGIDKACSKGFNKIGDDIYTLVFFKHAVKIIVNEEGTEAAAVSMAGMDNYAGVDEVTCMTFDSPFIYVIQDTISETVLFMGAVTEF